MHQMHAQRPIVIFRLLFTFIFIPPFSFARVIYEVQRTRTWDRPHADTPSRNADLFPGIKSRPERCRWRYRDTAIKFTSPYTPRNPPFRPFPFPREISLLSLSLSQEAQGKREGRKGLPTRRGRKEKKKKRKEPRRGKNID